MEVQEYLDFLLKVCPNWLSIVENTSGKILKMDKSIQMSVIKETIEKANLNM